MELFFVTFGIMLVAVFAMAIGVMLGRLPIAGSCGGLNSADGTCQSCSRPCKSRGKSRGKSRDKSRGKSRGQSQNTAMAANENKVRLQSEITPQPVLLHGQRQQGNDIRQIDPDNI